MREQTLFDISLPSQFVARPDTREQAAAKVRPTIRDVQRMLLRDLYDGKSVAADEWAIERGLSPYLVRPRVSCMKKAGMLFRCGYALTVESNNQERYVLFPYIQTRMRLLVCKYGIERATDEILTHFNPEGYAKRK